MPEAISVKGKRGKQSPTPAPDPLCRDFVVIHQELHIVQQCQQMLCDGLAQIGLKLHPDKTLITHTLHPHEGRVGLDFLEMTVRQFPVGKYRTAYNNGSG